MFYGENDLSPSHVQVLLSRPRVVKESSSSGVKLEQAAEPVLTANGFAFREWVWRGEEEKIALTLVVPFKMMMIDVFVQRPA